MDGSMDGDGIQCGTGVSAFRDWKRSSKTQARADTSNITRLLAFREVSPSLRRPKKRLWGADAASVEGGARDARPANVKQALGEWVEADSLRHCSAKYTSLHPAPRSTIAAAFSLDGETLASTHGDHTVKIINCQTGKCVKVFSGHRRTPWVVRFHPFQPDMLVSGSLDHLVRLWNTRTGVCHISHDFLRPIASLAFHASGDLLAVASGHKLYMWQYNTEGEAASPAIVLRTRRSLRAVHFHPHGAPLLLTAEVNDLDSNDCPPATATARSYSNPPPTTMAYMPATLPTTAAGAPPRPPVFASHAGPNAFSTSSAHPGSNGQTSAWPPAGTPMPLPAPAGPVAGTPWNDFWSFEGQQQGQRQGQQHGFGFSNPSDPPSFGFRNPPPPLFGNLQPYHPAQSHEQPQRGGPAGPSGAAGFPPRPWANTSGQRAFHSPPLERSVERPSSRMSEAEGPVQMEVSPRPAEGDRWLQRPEAAVAPVSTSGVARALSFSGAASASQSTVLARTDSGGLERHPSDTTEAMAIDLASVVSPPPPLSYLNVAPSPATRTQTHAAGSHPEPNVAQGYPFTQPLPALGIPPLPQMDLPFWGGWARLGQEPGAGLRGQAPALAGAGPTHAQHAAQGGQQALSVASVAMAAAMAAARAAAQAGAGMMGVAGVGMGHASGMAGGHLNQLPRPFQDMGPAAEAAASAALAAAAAAELPCTVKLRVWPHDINQPTALLDSDKCRLTIPHAVLCSEMGAHFSPCGRFLAACVACRSPPDQEDAFTQTLRALNGGALHSFGGHPAQFPSPPPLQPDSPPQPLQANSVVYELRLYSLEEGTFGEVLASRTVRAAHCLTSIQFSPTSQHILLAYGRRHNTLLRSLVTDGAGIIPVYTILEVYRVADMSLVRVLPSAEDEINVAAFHPQVGGGLVYGTKEGKLRTVTHDRRPRQSSARRQLEDELLEAESNDGPYNLRNFQSTEAGQMRQMEAR